MAARADVCDLDRARAPNCRCTLTFQCSIHGVCRSRWYAVADCGIGTGNRPGTDRRASEAAAAGAGSRRSRLKYGGLKYSPSDGRERSLVVVDAIAAPHDRASRRVERPREADARREVVAIRLVAAARHVAGADRHQLAGRESYRVARSSLSTGGEM